MKRFSLVFVLVSIVLNVSSAPKIILKFDDLSVKSNTIASKSMLDMLVRKQVKASFGIIADRCDQTALPSLTPYLNATNPAGEKLFEVWHHGLDHKNPEFGGRPYDYQKSHFTEADSLIKALLNIQMRTFGAPFNANDANTVKVVSENENYKVTLFGRTPPVDAGYINLNNRVNVETSTANPSYSAFVDNYNAKKNTYTDYMVLQAHPNNWSASKLKELEQTIDFLLAEGCEFVTPFGYYQSLYGVEPSMSPQQERTIVSINTAKSYQTIDGFGDCSMWQPLKDTYNTFHATNPEKLDEIADMMFTSNNPDSSFNFRFNHQVDIMACIDQSTDNYIPKSQKDNTDAYWYAQKLAERGGKISFRQSAVSSVWYLDEEGKSRNNDIPRFMKIMANIITHFSSDYGYLFSDYTPMNESADGWDPPGRPKGANVHLSDEETVSMVKEARIAFDAAGLNDIKLAAFDALYLNNYPRLNNMLNSDALGLLDHLSYHQYQKNEGFQEYWYDKSLSTGLKLYQSEWGDWDNLDDSEEHAQGMNYATHIFRALSRGKVSAWFAWELKFIFRMNEQGWAPKEAAWMIAQYSRFADPGMEMVQVNHMGPDDGTLAFMSPDSGARDLSYITYNQSADPVDYIYDLNGFTNPQIKDIRQTSAFDSFKKLDYNIDAKNRLYVTVPPEAMLSIRVRFDAVIDSSTVIDQSNWSLVYVTSEETGRANDGAVNAFDGDDNTFWHSKWNGADAFPHDLILDLGADYLISGFSYLPRQDVSTNGTIGDYDLYLSMDGENWDNAVSSGRFSKDKEVKKVTFYPSYGRYVKFVSKSAAYGDAFSSCAEIDLYMVNKPTQKPEAKFELSDTIISTGQFVTFKDVSTHNPSHRTWYVDKGTTTETVNNEVFNTQFLEPGVFDVTLVVWNDNGKDSITLKNHLTVKQDIEAPSVPTDVSAVHAYHHAVLNWKASSDEISDHVLYNVYLDEKFVEQVSSSRYVFSGLKENQAYKIGVKSVDVTGNESALAFVDISTNQYIEEVWVDVPVINNSFELPDNGQKLFYTSQLPGWWDDQEENNAIARAPYGAATDGNMVSFLASHIGGTLYQPISDIVVEEGSSYRLSYSARASYFNNNASVGKVKATLAAYELNENATQRADIASVETDLPASQTSFVKHEVVFNVEKNSTHIDKLLVVELDLLNLTGANWMQLDNVKLEKKIGVTTSVDQVNSTGVTIFPNPAHDNYITIDGLTDRARIDMYLISGRKCTSVALEGNRMNLKNVSDGVYILKIEDDNKTITKKLVVNR